jgi:hypothetical protein
VKTSATHLLQLLDRAAASGEALIQDLATLLARALRREPLERLEALDRSSIRLDPHGSQIIAEIHACGGRRDEALDRLRNAIQVGGREQHLHVGAKSLLRSATGRLGVSGARRRGERPSGPRT